MNIKIYAKTKEQKDEEQNKVNKIIEDYENQIEREANDE